MTEEKLFFQFYKAICLALSLGTDKHSYKKSGCKKVKIYSYEDRRNIIKCMDQLCKFIECTYPEICKIKEINEVHIEMFLRYKGEFCTKNTINNYKYCIRKIEKIINQYLYIRVKYLSSNLNIKVKKEYLRDIEMEKQDIELLLNECRRSNSKAVDGIILSIYFGLRVAEICKLKGKDIDLENKILHIHESKGKKSRDIKIDNYNKLEICIKIKSLISENERICKLKEDSINAVIRRMLLKNKITKYSMSRTGIHSIRKYYAKKSYNKNLEVFKDEIKAWDTTAKELGHGKGRKVLKNVYVKI